MSNIRACSFHLARLPAVVLLCAGLASGCGDNSGVGETFPVTGKITIHNEPLTAASTVVLFTPDASKGNTSQFEPAGTVDEDGNYTLTTKGKKGAPPGWYKVIVTATASAPVHARTPKQHPRAGQSLIPAKYGLAKTTDLVIEVVANPSPGSYDLKLTR
jgi:hypothetical protein